MKLLQWQRKTFQPMVTNHGGEWLKEVGDGLLLSFPSSQNAVRCAICIQEAAQEVPNLKLRVGIHQGDIIQDGSDILGDGVNIASRIEGIAPPGGIAFSDKIQQDITGYPEFEMISLGEHTLRGVPRPLPIYCLAPYGLPNFPEYKLLRRTGRGAYGEVWLAKSLTGVFRAVKIVRRDQFEDEKPYEREFTGITEYEPLSRKNGGLIDLLHVGRSEDDSFFYYVMELADNQRSAAEINFTDYQPKTLQSELEIRGKLTVEECLKIGSRLARGLAFLHSQNLVHRDIKPANVVFVEGQPKLADIGLVTTMDKASTLVGTMGYIPPEGPGKPSSDIYALGMVLYELSTGKDRADFPEIDVLDPALSGLNQACLKACSNDLNERFTDANAFADDLDRLSGETVMEQSASTTPVGSYKVGALAAALILILGLIIFQRTGGPEESGKDERGNLPSASKKPVATPPTDPPFDPKKGLVAYYPFGGNAKDESGNGNDGQVQGAELVADRRGNNAGAYKFDGLNDYINCGNSTTLQIGAGSHTLSAWASPREGAKINGDYISIVSKSTVQKGWVFQFPRNLSGIKLWHSPNACPTAPRAFSANKWVHVLVVRDVDEGTISFYIDGRKIFNRTHPKSDFSTGATMYIGQHERGIMFFKGLLDDLRIYNRALSAEEIAALYASEKVKAPVVKPQRSFENTLGMKFVPVPGTDVQFCIWETRVQDYAAYAAANRVENTKWKLGPGFGQTPTCPVVWVDWNEARAFCAWLTKKEQAAGKLKPGQRYRLPTDAEWSVAVGLGKEPGNTPEEKNGGIKGVYPWGNEHPAPQGAGNYYGSMRVDRFSWTSPVGSFAANALGIHDLGGNVWEWCEDKMTPASTLRVMRGLSWHNYAIDSGSLLSSVRGAGPPEKTGDVYGFRVVLEQSKTSGPAAPILTKGLVAYYPFNGNAKDETDNGHDGTLINGAKLTSDREGEAGKALSVPTQGAMARIPYHPNLSISDRITVSAWIKVPRLRQGIIKSAFLGIIDTGGVDVYAGYYMRIQNDHKMWIIISAGGGRYNHLTSQTEFGKEDEWVHVTFSYDDNELVFYVDGKRDAAKKVGANFLKGWKGALPFKIGSDQSGSLLGAVDDVRIYNRVLSAGEVTALYNLEKPKE